MNLKTRLWVSLIGMALADTIIPIPFTTILLIYVLSEKPAWFKDLVDSVYRA